MKKKYSIGEVSKLMNIPIKALRNYHALDLIKPFYVDQSNNYRYYSYDQFFKIDLIRYLNKSLQVSLNDIKYMLDETNDYETLINFLEQHKDEMTTKIKKYEYSRNMITKVIQDIKKSPCSNISNRVFEQYLLRRNIYLIDANVSIHDIDLYFKRNEDIFQNTTIEVNNICFVYDINQFKSNPNDLIVSQVGILSDKNINNLKAISMPEGRYLSCKFHFSENESINTLSKIIDFSNHHNLMMSDKAIQVFNILDLNAKSKYEYEMEIQVYEINK